MKVDREKAVTQAVGDETCYFCSTHCLHAFEAGPEKYRRGNGPVEDGQAAHAHH